MARKWARTTVSVAMLLVVDTLTKSFGARAAVAGVSFSVRPGEVMGLVGRNGAGKTTTMRMIAGYLEPDRGTAKIAGYDIVTQRRTAQSRLGYLPEGGPLYGEMTPWGMIEFMALARGLSRLEASLAADRAILDAGLETAVNQTIDTLSKGFKRRVSLAAAILHDPPVLILDEPTDGLDPKQRRSVRELIRRMAPGKAILISTHNLEDVEAMCSRVLIFDRGRVLVDDHLTALSNMAASGRIEDVFLSVTAPEESS